MTIDNGTSVKTLKFYYDAAGIPMCLDYNGTMYFYITNLQGDVVALADQYGEVIRYEYDAWGKPIISEYYFSSHSEVMQNNPLRYRGYIYDSETGFYYLQSRYYDPAVGRFINSDSYASTGQGILGHNMFAYCGNNPVNRSDTTGQSWAIVGIVIVLAVILTIPGSSVSTTDSDVLVMSNSKSGWMESSKAMGQSMKYAARASSSYVEAITTSNFSQMWNNTTSDYVVIHTHGSPDGLFGENLSFTTNDVSTLNRNSNIQCLVITSCEVGGSNGSKDNIGQMLSQKISPNGIVICSTTIVSGNDKSFEATSGGKWVVYQNGIQVEAVFPTTITMSTVVDYWNDFSN